MDIVFKDVSYIYQNNTPMASVGLQNINLTIHGGTYTAIIGQTGSGKSTLVRHLNALLKPTTGSVQVGQQLITHKTKEKDLHQLRQHVGMVFQFAEKQLFESTVGRDIAVGPINFGMSMEQALQRAHQMLDLVELPQRFFDKSPFELSGGQMRRVAIAGVLAMQPQVLVLDEPTAGLDPQAHVEMMQLFARLHQQQHLTIVLVSHHMEDVVNYADQVVVMAQQHVLKTGTPAQIFSDPQWVTENQLSLPISAIMAQLLQQKYFHFDKLPLTSQQLAQQIAQQLMQKGDERH